MAGNRGPHSRRSGGWEPECAAAGPHAARARWRDDPDHPQARYYYARALLDRKGPFKARQFIQRDPELADAPPAIRADWLALVGFVNAMFRDFTPAHQRFAQAEALAPTSPWLCVERAALLEREDRCADALQAAQRSLDLQPWFRPGVQMVAHLLQQLDHDHEALAMLSTAAEQIESFYVVLQLADLQSELGDHAGARANYDRLASEFPVLEPKSTRWLSARRSNAAYHCGDFAESQRLAEESKEPFFTKIAEALAAAKGDERRVQLPVGFVRQHYLTCARRRCRPSAGFGRCPPIIWTWPMKSATTARPASANASGPTRMAGWLASSRSPGVAPWRSWTAACRSR